jgi:hypothetical protein
MDKLASQPTVSRRLNELDKESFKIMESVNAELLTRAYKAESPKFFIFDIDSTEIETYGNQFGPSYNFHFKLILKTNLNKYKSNTKANSEN